MLHLGGSKAGQGAYWNLADGSTVVMPSGGGTLPGAARVPYMKRPPGGAFTATAVFAVFYALSFPVLGPAALLLMWLVPIAGVCVLCMVAMQRGSHRVAEGLSFGWQPIAAYLAGRKGRKNK